MRSAQIKTAFIITALLLLVFASASYAIDPPHDIYANCSNCHNSSALSNTDNKGNIDNTPMNYLCMDCHYQGSTIAKAKVTHSANTTNLSNGLWTIECRACHDPHYQRTLRAYPNDYSTGSGAYLSGGTVASLAQKGGVTNVIVMTGATLGLTPSGDTDWSGYVVKPNKTYSFFYRIANSTGNTITVETPLYNPTLYVKAGSILKVARGMNVGSKDSSGTVAYIRSPFPIENSGGVVYQGKSFRSVKLFNSAGAQSYAASLTDTTAVCIVCHTRTTYNNIGYATYGQTFDNITTDYLAGGTTGGTDHTGGSSLSACWTDSAGCHKPPDEGLSQPATAACGDCHGNPILTTAGMINTFGSDQKTGRTSIGAHPKHAAYFPAKCEYCHLGGGAGQEGGHPVLGVKNTLNFGFAFGYTGGIYCAPAFPNANFTAFSNQAATVVFNGVTGAQQFNCSNIYCHSNGGNFAGVFSNKTATWTGGALSCNSCHGDATRYVITDNHNKHANGGAGYTYKCEQCHNTVVDVNNTIISNTLHVNGSKQVAFGSMNPVADAYGTVTTGVCSNIYCHSNGRGTSYKTPTWAGATTACTDCHDQAGAATTLSPAHRGHTDPAGDNIKCKECHWNVVSSNTAISNYALHVDGVKNVYINSTWGGSGTSYQGNGTCVNTYCHGVKSPSWSEDLTAYNECTRCHGEKTASPTEAQKAPGGAGIDTNGDTSASDANVGAHQAHFNTAYSASSQCSDCHLVPATTMAANHIDNSLPAEVIFSSFAKNVGALNPAYNYSNGQCTNVYCHGNKMPSGSAKGLGNTPVWNSTTYLTHTPNMDGDCDQCHLSPPTGYADTDHNGVTQFSQCVGCHSHMNPDGTFTAGANRQKHINGIVEGVSCGGCHGMPPTTVASMINSPATYGLTGRTTQFAATPYGKHDLHYNTKNIDCSSCHNGGGSSGQHNSGGGVNGVTLGFVSNVAGSIMYGGSYNAPTFSNTNYSLNNGAGMVITTAGQTQRLCNNIYCHSDGGNYAGVFSNKAANWDGGSLACNGCHGDATKSVSTNVHPKHTDGTTYSITCVTCHAATVNVSNAIIGNHIDGFKNVAWSGIAVGGTYTRPNCTTEYCHSDGGNYAGTKTYKTASWTGGSLACNGCHGDATNSVITNVHPKHVNGTTYSFACVTCHSATVNVGNTIVGNHVDGVKNVAWSGIAVGGTYTRPNCTTEYCHSDGGNYAGTKTYKTASWTGTSLACNGCHGDASNSVITNAHPKHINGTTYSFACVTCHSATVNVGNTIIGNHVDGVKNVAWSGIAAGGTYTRPNCTTEYCHSDGGNYAGTMTYKTASWTGGSLACNGCHGDATKSVATNAHPKHTDGTTYSITCVTCHSATVNVGNAIIGNHVDGVKNVAWSGIAAGGTYTRPNCTTEYCHSDGGNYAGTKTYKTASWTGGSLACNGCHGDATNSVATNAHVAHINSTTYNFTCVTCHSATVNVGNAIIGNHVDGVKNVAMSGVAAGGTYSRPNCTNLYCHSDGGNYAGTKTYKTASWTGSSMACNTCHGDATKSVITDAHPKHINGTTYSFSCYTCHSATVNVSNTIIGNHLDGVKNVVFNSIAAGGTYTRPNCTTEYCHSDGGNYAGTKTYKTASWTGGSLACNGCHGDATSSVTTNAHLGHVNSTTYNITCVTCHSATVNVSNTIIGNHVDNVKNVAMSGVAAGGTYARPTCNTTYCHSNGNGSYLTNPSWNSGTSMNCGSCHEALPTTVVHTSHINNTTVQANRTCDACHVKTASSNSAYNATTYTSYHVNNVKDVNTAAAWGGTYVTGTKTCNNVYCHTDGKGGNAAITWTVQNTTCTACHAGATGTGGASTALSTAHLAHTNTTGFNFGCVVCHGTVVSSNTAISTSSKHVDGFKNVAIALANGGTGTDGGDYGGSTCATTACHGTNSIAWTNTTMTKGNCSICHGFSDVSNTARDTNGDTAANDAQVGAHLAHIKASSMTMSAPFTCAACHPDPSGATYEIRVNTHMGNTPAEMQWSTFATNGGTLTPSWSTGTVTCYTNYCHGGHMPKGAYPGVGNAPVWTNTTYVQNTAGTWDVTCSQCHGFPPLEVTAHNGKPTNDGSTCNSCHSNVYQTGSDESGWTANGTAFIDKSQHVNGTVEAASGCDGCHAFPPYVGDGKAYKGSGLEGKGAHVKHVNDLKRLKGITLDPGDYFTNSTTIGQICGTCHDTTSDSNHQNGDDNRSIVIPSSYTFGPTGSATYNGAPNTSSSTQFKTCLNVSCHFTPSPGWQNTTDHGL